LSSRRSSGQSGVEQSFSLQFLHFSSLCFDIFDNICKVKNPQQLTPIFKGVIKIKIGQNAIITGQQVPFSKNISTSVKYLSFS